MSRAFRLKMEAQSARSLAADGGSFALTGQAGALHRDRRVVAANGAFALTGQSAALTRAPQSYTTTFPLTENPISESGRWVSQDTNRTRMRTAGGVAYGTQTGGGFDDSYAYLNGIWQPNTEIITTVFKGTTSGIMEVEHLHRVTDTSGLVHCYEIVWAHDGQYVDIVSWNGATTSGGEPYFTYLITSLTYSISGGVSSGYRFRSTCIGNVLTAYVDRNDSNGFVLVNGGDGSGSASDTRNAGDAMWTTGGPGIGAFKTSGSGNLDQWALTDFYAAEI